MCTERKIKQTSFSTKNGITLTTYFSFLQYSCISTTNVNKSIHNDVLNFLWVVRMDRVQFGSLQDGYTIDNVWYHYLHVYGRHLYGRMKTKFGTNISHTYIICLLGDLGFDSHRRLCSVVSQLTRVWHKGNNLILSCNY